MIIDCVSDLHGQKPAMNGGDLLILAGDYTCSGEVHQWMGFLRWLRRQPYRKKVMVAGNHDNLYEVDSICDGDIFLHLKEGGIEYLEDSGCEWEGLKFWGLPWTLKFCNWNFMVNDEREMKKKADLIPLDTDIVVSHSPMWGILDGKKGSLALRQAVERVQPRLHVCGHIHEGAGMCYFKNKRDTLCVNASLLDENYEERNSPKRVVFEKEMS